MGGMVPFPLVTRIEFRINVPLLRGPIVPGALQRTLIYISLLYGSEKHYDLYSRFSSVLLSL